MAKPKLRFLEFTDEWEEKQLKDFMVFKNGLNADKDKFGSGIKFISVMDILNNPFITYDIIRGKVDVDEKTLDNYSVTYGDVLFQRSSETREDAGKSNVYLDKKNTATFGGFVIRGKKIGDYSPEFMNSLLKTPKVRKEITSKAQGAQHINVGQETLENVSIALPTVKEQEKIADFLSSVDDLVQMQGEKIAVLEEQKKGIMQKLFNREVRFKADDGSEYPEWEERRLESLCYNIKSGKTKCIEEDGGYILYGSTGMIGKTNNIEYDGEYILVARVGANAGTVTLRKGKFGVSDNTLIVDNKENVDTKFLRFLLQNYNLKKLIFGSGQPLVTSGQLKKIEIQIPVKEEQNKIADCLSAYDEVIQIKKDKLEVWKEIKKGLLQQMFV